MDLNERLVKIAGMADKCDCIADIGTDHGYIPIYLVKNNICNKAIASDINKGPLEKARKNILAEGLQSRIECRRGSGLVPINSGEIQGAVIAGMGGNLIRDIISDSPVIFRELRFAVIQPVQNTEVLRKYIYEQGLEILDEELCYDEDKFYEIIKVRYGNKPVFLDDLDYEISPVLISKKHGLMKPFVEFKLNRYNKIADSIFDETESAILRKEEVKKRIGKLEEVMRCL